MKYAYEAIMTNEFRTLDLECSNLVPLGPGYENVTLENQVCAVVGAIPGQPAVNGLRHLKLSYNYDWSHMWRVRNSFIPYRTLIPRSHIFVFRILASLSLLALLSLPLTSSSPSSNPNSPRGGLSSHSSAELNSSRILYLNLTT